ncbi:MAG: hypothetical protein HZB29_06805 [Nitrospinae bacterium]|nr:hypothetical protein [Nitrospinota bacterium]
MITSNQDEEVDPLVPENNINQLSALLGLLTGQKIVISKLCSAAQKAVESFLIRVNKHRPDNIKLCYEEFNELLLLFNQDRVEKPFFNFFFLSDGSNQDTLRFSQIKNGIKKFRVYALLLLGNFRFAFRKLSTEKSEACFVKYLEPWNRISKKELEKLYKRQPPLTPLYDTKDEIARNYTGSPDIFHQKCMIQIKTHFFKLSLNRNPN